MSRAASGRVRPDRRSILQPMNARADFDLASLLSELRRRAWLVVAITIGAALLAFGASQFQKDRFVATADLLFQEEVNANAPERTAATNLALADTDAVVAGVRRRLRLDTPAKELSERVELQPLGQANLVEIEASGDTASAAAQLANAFADEVVAVRLATAQAEVQRRIDSLDGRLAETDLSETELADDLVERRKSLLVDKALATGDVEVIDRASPPLERAAPKPLRNAGIAGVLGLIIAVMLLSLLRALDRRLTDQQAVDLFGAPILARIPVKDSKAWRQQLHEDAFHFLRANLVAVMADEANSLGPRALREHANTEGRVLVVASPLPSDGKSTTVARLAEALAASGARVLAIDADLRKPTLGGEFGMDPGAPGLADILLNDHDPAEVFHSTSAPNLSVLPGGVTSADFGMPTPRRLLRIVEALRSHADILLVDTAPVSIAAETSIVAGRANGVIVVLNARNLDGKTLTAARDQLKRAGSSVIGLVLNFAEPPSERALKGSYGRPYRAVPPPSQASVPAGADEPPGSEAESADEPPAPATRNPDEAPARSGKKRRSTSQPS